LHEKIEDIEKIIQNLRYYFDLNIFILRLAIIPTSSPIIKARSNISIKSP
jgi:hypothetical protein